jgi:hypothetical protein
MTMSSTSTDRRQGVNVNAAVKVPCKAATTANITLSGLQTIDGVALAADDRVLVKDQNTASENGIYRASTSTWQRDKDFDGVFDVVKGTLVHITDGTSYSRTWWEVTTSDPITPGSTSLTFTQGITDAANITFEPDGAGAIAESVRAMGRRLYFADQYGTLQQALTAAAGNVLYIRSDFTLTAIVDVSANTTVIIDQATLNFTNGSAGGDIRIGGQNVKIYGRGGKINFESIQCLFTGAAVNVDGLHVEGLEVTCSTAGAGHGIQINTTGTADNITVRGNRWVNCRHSILLNDGPSSMDNIIVTENRIKGGYRDGVEINRPTSGSTDVIVSNNVIELDATGSSASTDGFAIAIEQCSRVQITGNVIPFSRREAIHLDGSSGDSNDYVVISGNVALSARDGVLMNEPGTRVTITNNVFQKSGSAGQSGIGIVADDETSIGNFVICNNVIDGFDDGIYAGFGGESIPIVQGNYISNCTTGIDIERAYQCQGICNNVIEDCTTGVETTSGGFVGKNVYRDVTTICDNTGQRATTLKGFSVIVTGTSTVNGANTVTVLSNLLTASARMFGLGTLLVFDETSNTNWAWRKNELTWDGSSFTNTPKVNTSGGGVLSTTAFAQATDDLQVTYQNSGATITTSLTVDFEGDLLIL